MSNNEGGILDKLKVLCYARLDHKENDTNAPLIAMSIYHTVGTQKRYRITLDLSVSDDFNPHQIDWDKLLEIDDDFEGLNVYIEDLN